MTTDKLPDVVWLHPDEDDWWPDGPDEHLTGSTPYVPKFALDAMTAERDALAEQAILRDGEIQVLKAQRNTLMERHKARVDERDSAREALAKAQKDAGRYRWLRQHPQFMGWDSDYQADFIDREIDAAAQPETKL